MSEQTATTSQQLVVDMITSLDGYGAAEGWPGWWGLEGPEYLGWLEREPVTDVTFLMGSTTYRLMSGMAQNAPADENVSDQESEITHRPGRSRQGGHLLDTAAALRVAEHHRAVRRSRRGRERVETDRHEAHPDPWQRQPVPLADGRGPGRQVPRGDLPGHHRQDGYGSDLRRILRFRPRPGGKPSLRQPHPAARVRPPTARRPAEAMSRPEQPPETSSRVTSVKRRAASWN